LEAGARVEVSAFVFRACSVRRRASALACLSVVTVPSTSSMRCRMRMRSCLNGSRRTPMSRVCPQSLDLKSGLARTNGYDPPHVARANALQSPSAWRKCGADQICRSCRPLRTRRTVERLTIMQNNPGSFGRLENPAASSQDGRRGARFSELRRLSDERERTASGNISQSPPSRFTPSAASWSQLTQSDTVNLDYCISDACGYAKLAYEPKIG
jgi:hypothetical protein